MSWLYLLAGSVFLFVLGTIIGSFLSVVILRSMRGESWVRGSSRCDECGKKIKWYDNIPLLSFLLLSGRCRYCQKPIHPVHFLVELLTGALFVWWFLGFMLFFQLTQQPFVVLQPLFWLMVAVILLIIFFIDLLYLLIPDWAVILLTLATATYRLTLVIAGIMQPEDFGRTLLATVAATGFLALLWAITKGKGLGFGDVKLMIPLGLLLGWPNTMVAIFLAFIIGAVVGLGLVIFRRQSLKQVVPFGPFLIVGTFLSLLWGNQLFDWYLNLIVK